MDGNETSRNGMGGLDSDNGSKRGHLYKNSFVDRYCEDDEKDVNVMLGNNVSP